MYGNWLIADTDAHAKNYSLLPSGDQVRPGMAGDLDLDADLLTGRAVELTRIAPGAFTWAPIGPATAVAAASTPAARPKPRLG